MKRFKSISVNENTFKAVECLTETLLEGTKLSKAQVVENLLKGSHEEITNKKENDHENQKDTTKDQEI